jgi:hypothetical protein
MRAGDQIVADIEKRHEARLGRAGYARFKQALRAITAKGRRNTNPRSNPASKPAGSPRHGTARHGPAWPRPGHGLARPGTAGRGLARRVLRCRATGPAGIISTTAYDVDVPFMQLERHDWDIHIV